jgi:uncharacterized membrane protein
LKKPSLVAVVAIVGRLVAIVGRIVATVGRDDRNSRKTENLNYAIKKTVMKIINLNIFPNG